MLKKILVMLFVAGSLIVASPVTPYGEILAEEADTCVTTTQYGGATQIVCGAKHDASEIDTGLADINPIVLASMFFGAAVISTIKAKNLKRAEVAL